MTNKIIFGLSLALLVVVVLYWESCHKSTLIPPTKSDSTVDSIVKRAIADTLQVHHFADSVNKENIVLKNQRDSLLHVLDVTKGSLKGKDKDIQALIDNINQAEAGNNQSAALAACDSLKAAYPIAKGLVTQYINTNDSLKRSTNQLLSNKDTIIGRLSSAFNEANNQVFELSRTYGNLSADYKKALKQANKRWSIGPSAGYGIAGKGMGPFIGISLNYSLFKF